jgi:hypothetical protein
MARKSAITKRPAGKTKTVAKAKGRARLSGLTSEAKQKAKAPAKAKARAPGPPARGSAPKLKVTPLAPHAGTSDMGHLISVIQAGTGASKKAAGETLDALLETVTLSLKKNKKVQLRGFG